MVNYFEFGETINLMDLPKEQAIAILGLPVYEVLRDTKGIETKGHMRVASINREKGEVTLEWRDED